MIIDFENHLLLRTVVEAEIELSRWVKHLSIDDYLELGDDPGLVDAIEQDLKEMAHRIRLLRSQFNLSRVPLSSANKYFATTGQLEDAVALVHAIREKGYGSQQNTRRCLAHLEACAESIREIANLVPSVSQVKH